MKRLLGALLFLPFATALLATIVFSDAPLDDKAQCRLSGEEPIVIYVSYASGGPGLKIVWQGITSGEYRTTGVLQAQGPPPDSCGLLPSPDGRWLVAWTADWAAAKTGSAPTLWNMIRVSDGKTLPLGHGSGVGGNARMLPYWIDNERVVLEGDGADSIFDVRTEKLSRPLPRDKDYGDDYERRMAVETARLLAYCRGHYPAELKALGLALEKIGKQLGLEDYLRGDPRTPPEYLLLRCLGIPGLYELSRYGDASVSRIDGFRVPHVAVSPDATRVAVAFVHNRALSRVDARLDVFDVASGRRLWGASIPATPWRQAPSFGSVVPHFTAPRFTEIRWSRDGRYLSFTARVPDEWVAVMDTSTWREALRIPNATNAFVITSANAPLPPSATLARRRKLEWGDLGLDVAWQSSDVARLTGTVEGVMVGKILPGTSAARTCLRPRDIITHFAGRRVSSEREFVFAVQGTRPGEKVPIRFVRTGRPISIEVIMGRLEDTVRPLAWSQQRAQPATPSLVLNAVAVPEPDQVVLYWDLNTEHPQFSRVTGVEVSRAGVPPVAVFPDSLNFTPLPFDPKQGFTHYADTTIGPGTSYAYRVTAIVDSIRDARSAPVINANDGSLVLTPIKPIPPNSVKAFRVGAAALVVWRDWQEDSPGQFMAGYRVYRSVDGAAFESLTPEVPAWSTNTFVDTDAPPGKLAYKVSAVSRHGLESELSPTAAVTESVIPLEDVTYGIHTCLVLAYPKVRVGGSAVPKLATSTDIRAADGALETPFLTAIDATQFYDEVVAQLERQDPRFRYKVRAGGAAAQMAHAEAAMTKEWEYGIVSDVGVTVHKPARAEIIIASLEASLTFSGTVGDWSFCSEAVDPVKRPPQRYLLGKTYLAATSPPKRTIVRDPTGTAVTKDAPACLLLLAFSLQLPRHHPSDRLATRANKAAVSHASRAGGVMAPPVRVIIRAAPPPPSTP